MPPVSEKQRRAMRAAAAGNSNIGIPKKVGAEYSSADKGGKLPESAPKDPPEKGSPPPNTQQSHEAREREVLGAGYEQHEAAEKASYSKGAHKFPAAPASASGFGHSGSQKVGVLRHSGHPKAHRIGKK